MNKADQKYLLNSEILVIVQHMMAKRKLELHKTESNASEGIKGMDESKANKEDRQPSDKDGGPLSSDEDLSYYSGVESPPLEDSDLCNSDVDTDDLLATTDIDTPEHKPTPAAVTQPRHHPPPLQKKGSFLQFMMKRAQKWKKRKSERVKQMDLGREIEEAETELCISAVCDDCMERTSPKEDIVKFSDRSDSCDKISTILDPRNLPRNTHFMLNPPEGAAKEPVEVICTVAVRDTQHVGVKEGDGVTITVDDMSDCKGHNSDCNHYGQMFNEKKSQENPVSRLPGLLISKHGYYGLSEGNIPDSVSKSESEISVNTILSDEHLLADYVHDMSLAFNKQDHLRLPGGLITKLVFSMENLSHTCLTAESLSKAEYRSLQDLRDVQGAEKQGWEHERTVDRGRVSGDNGNESARSDWALLDDVDAPIASGEATPWKNEIYCSDDEDNERSVNKSPARNRLLQTLIKYVRQFPKGFQRKT